MFEFDLGGRLVVKPWRPEDEAWMLYEPTGNVLVLRADKRFSQQHRDACHDRAVWLPAWSSD